MSFFSDFRSGMEKFGETIAVIPNTILLSAVYVIGVGLTVIFARLTGIQSMEKRERKSYWSDFEEDKENYRMF